MPRADSKPLCVNELPACSACVPSGRCRWIVYVQPMVLPVIDVEERAAALFEQGFTCGQAVLAAFADSGGLDQEAALRVACAFGGGIARAGGTCGAVSGALMAIGLRLGQTRVENVAARERTHAATRTFLAEFRSEYGSDVCRDLLGVEIGTPAGLEAAIAAGLFKTRCPAFVRGAARLVSKLADAESA